MTAQPDANPAYSPEDGSRRSKKREKQRANRQRKRQLKQDAAAENAEAEAAAGKPEKGRRHRPSPMERRMNLFMKIYDWSHLFVTPGSWPSYAKSSNGLNLETVEAISRVVEQSGLGGPQRGGGATPSYNFRSVRDLRLLAAAKKAEVAYIERQLGAMPSFSDPAWNAYCARLASGAPVEETLQGPADFLQDTIVPRLKTQVQSLEARANRVEGLQKAHEELRKQREEQEELPGLVACLRETQAMLIPVCPVWKEVKMECEKTQKMLLDPKELVRLREAEERARLEFEEAVSSTYILDT